MLLRNSALSLTLLSGLNAAAYAGAPAYKVTPISQGHDRFYDVAFASDGSYYAVGSVADTVDATSDARFAIAKYKASGELDTTFGKAGYVIHNVITAASTETARGVLVQKDGKIVVAGPVEAAGVSDARDRDIALIRLNADGTLDRSFGKDGVSIVDFSKGEVNGTAYVADSFGGVALDANQRVLVHGSKKRDGALDTDYALARLNANGTLDTTFATAGVFSLDINGSNASPKPPVVLPNGSILGAGYQSTDGVVVPVIYKLTAAGQLDTSYGVNGIFSQAVLAAVTEVYAVALQGTSIVTVGYGRNNPQESLDFLSLRILENGTLDTTYGTNGGYTRIDADGYNDNGRNMTVLPDDRILLIGGGRYAANASEGMMVVLNSDGTPDENFGENGSQLLDFGGAGDFLWGAKASPQGDKVIAVGIKGDAAGDDAVVVTLPL
ncbi:MAG TPA: delta-60 repeat domain-containing protein [Oligoflexus sp.]|uniref:delta-60 repeat domain-containing protein n=1 Tax=Oligoflexus sp. TaxID=1971216 RepID=UPI002D4FCD3E|nr:delta-60 repeat domain-containing protein [Oligoflexus sp.]HYX34176.1 delta-60 repeat domain-containing protein [Oligoflexus sp.]